MRLLSVGSGCVLLAALAALVATRDDVEPTKEERAARIADLIRRLGHQEYDEREAAAKELAAAGEPALPPLRAALVGSDDPEVRIRAQRVIRAILWSVRNSKSTGLEMVPVSSGEFVMGSPKNERYRKTDETQHAVRITKPFLMGVYEVTQAQYEKVMVANTSWYSLKGGGRDKLPAGEIGKFPVEGASWFDAIEFCNKLSRMDGYEPYYYELVDVKREGNSIADAKVNVLGGNGYRLPTEAEWEYACRAGTTRPFHFGNGGTGREANLKPSPDAGGYGGSPSWAAIGRPTFVGGYKANGFGLCDVHGNVGEWCSDWYDADYYEKSPADNPTGPDKGTQRVVRGGSWMVPETSGRAATRFSLAPGERKDYVGFRVARTP